MTSEEIEARQYLDRQRSNRLRKEKEILDERERKIMEEKKRRIEKPSKRLNLTYDF